MIMNPKYSPWYYHGKILQMFLCPYLILRGPKQHLSPMWNLNRRVHEVHWEHWKIVRDFFSFSTPWLLPLQKISSQIWTQVNNLIFIYVIWSNNIVFHLQSYRTSCNCVLYNLRWSRHETKLWCLIFPVFRGVNQKRRNLSTSFIVIVVKIKGFIDVS